MNKRYFPFMVALLLTLCACSPKVAGSQVHHEPIMPDNVEQLTQLVSIGDRIINNYSADIEFSPDGQFIITLGHLIWEPGDSNRADVVVWEAETGIEQARQSLEIRILNAVAFHPNQPIVALGGENSAVYLWDYHSGETVLVTGGIPWSPGGSMTFADGSVVERVPVTSLAFSRNGTILAVGYSEGWGHSTVELYAISRGAQQENFEPYWAHIIQRGGWLDLAFIPDDMLLTGSHDNSVYLWDPITGELLDQHQLFTGDKLITDMAYSQDGELMITTIWDQINNDQTSFWDAETFENVDLLNHLGGLKALNLDASMMAVAGENEVSLWDIATKTQLTTIEVSGKVSAITFSPDGALLAFANPGGKIHLWGIPQE